MSIEVDDMLRTACQSSENGCLSADSAEKENRARATCPIGCEMGRPSLHFGKTWNGQDWDGLCCFMRRMIGRITLFMRPKNSQYSVFWLF